VQALEDECSRQIHQVRISTRLIIVWDLHEAITLKMKVNGRAAIVEVG